jgi:hypothetical protein
MVEGASDMPLAFAAAKAGASLAALPADATVCGTSRDGFRQFTSKTLKEG